MTRPVNRATALIAVHTVPVWLLVFVVPFEFQVILISAWVGGMVPVVRTISKYDDIEEWEQSVVKQ